MVGSSLKPKLVRPGRISVRLKSQKFMADEAAGEDQEMVKDGESPWSGLGGHAMPEEFVQVRLDFGRDKTKFFTTF